MVLWTPILSIINYLNDLNIQHTFADLVLKDDGALTYTNFKEVVTKVTENSNFLKYLVMLTPMLAYALAKGSEMGFVSIASSLSQQLAGGARAAGGFATQQALSTSTAITTPRGDEVYAREAGVSSQKGAFYDGNGRLTTFNTQTNGYNGVENSELNNSIFSTTNVGGLANGTQFSNGVMQSAVKIGQTATDTYNKEWSDAYKKLSATTRSSMYEAGRQLMESDSQEFKENFNRALESVLSSDNSLSAGMKAELKAYAKAQGGVSMLGNEVVVGAEGSISHNFSVDNKWTDTQKDSFAQAIVKANAQALTMSDTEGAKFAKGLQGSDSTEFGKMLKVSKSYQETTDSVQAVTGNNADNMLNYHAQHLAFNDGKAWSGLSTAEQNQYFTQAGNDINDMLKNNHAALSQLNKQVGAAGITQDGSFGIKAQGMNFKEINVSECGAYLDYMKNARGIGANHEGKANLYDMSKPSQGSHGPLQALQQNVIKSPPMVAIPKGINDAAGKLF